MIRAFIDASVLFAASLSPTGASREIIRQAVRGQVTLVASKLVYEEVEKNLADKAPAALPAFRQFLATVPFETVRPTKRQVLQAARYSALKDAPIVAAAKRARVDYLVSLDRRHLVGVKEVAQRSGLRIVLPSEFLGEVRRQAASAKE
jgi:predicted nucleic acid-binding protein